MATWNLGSCHCPVGKHQRYQHSRRLDITLGLEHCMSLRCNPPQISGFYLYVICACALHAQVAWAIVLLSSSRALPTQPTAFPAARTAGACLPLASVSATLATLEATAASVLKVTCVPRE